MAQTPKIDFATLEERIGHVFADRSLLQRALTHLSAVKTAAARIDFYQRLEFLGDRVLGLTISEMLFARFPKAEEGELSRRLAALVRKETCAEVAREWGVGDYVRFGGGENLSGDAKTTTILADVCEAVIAAVYLDAGLDAARALIARSWAERMMAPKRALRDSKTALQEWAQARGAPAPVYAETERLGPAHAPLFTVEVQVDGFESIAASGATKRVAEQSAAQAFMEREAIVEPRRKTTPAASESETFV